jgi:hypothetical protein
MRHPGAGESPVELGRVLVELFSNKSLLRLWRKRAASNLSWLRIGRVLLETMNS